MTFLGVYVASIEEPGISNFNTFKYLTPQTQYQNGGENYDTYD